MSDKDGIFIFKFKNKYVIITFYYHSIDIYDNVIKNYFKYSTDAIGIYNEYKNISRHNKFKIINKNYEVSDITIQSKDTHYCSINKFINVMVANKIIYANFNKCQISFNIITKHFDVKSKQNVHIYSVLSECRYNFCYVNIKNKHNYFKKNKIIKRTIEQCNLDNKKNYYTHYMSVYLEHSSKLIRNINYISDVDHINNDYANNKSELIIKSEQNIY